MTKNAPQLTVTRAAPSSAKYAAGNALLPHSPAANVRRVNMAIHRRPGLMMSRGGILHLRIAVLALEGCSSAAAHACRQRCIGGVSSRPVAQLCPS